VIIAIVPTVTVVVLTLNVAVVAPAATVTEVGTVAAVLLLASITTAPPAGAAALSVTVPVLFAPPVRLPGFSVIEASAATEVVSRMVLAVAVALGVAVAVAGGVGVTVAVGVGVGASKPLTRMSWPFALKEPTKKSPVTGSMHAPSG
jgi:hypothetical protein